MDPSKPPRLTRPTMNRSSVELKAEITENLRFLQRQMEVHYGHRATFRSDATIQFLAKVVGLTRQLREQWTRYVELDSTIRDEFPVSLPHRPQTEAEKNESAVRRDDLLRQPNDPSKHSSKEEKPQRPAQTRTANSMNTGAKPKETKKRPDIIPANDSTDNAHRPRSKDMWSQRTTTTIFDGGRRPRKLNRHAQQTSASYIQEPEPWTNKPPVVIYDGSCDKMVNGRQCKFRPYYDCPRHYLALSNILKKKNGHYVDDNDDQNYYGKYVDEQGNQMPYDQINAVYRYPPGARLEDVDWWGMSRVSNPHNQPLIWIYIKAEPSNRNTQVSEALGLADSGCTRDECGVNYAARCGLKIITNDRTTLYTASGQPMTCVGSARATISYFNVVAH